MKKIYKKPKSRVIVLAPESLLEGSPTPPETPVDPSIQGQDALGRETVRYTTIPSDELWEE